MWKVMTLKMTDLPEPADYQHVPLTQVGVRSVGPVSIDSGVRPERYIVTSNPSESPNSSPTPIDTQARALAHHAKWAERDNPTIARLLREASARIEGLTVAYRDLDRRFELMKKDNLELCRMMSELRKRMPTEPEVD
jgi:hypothetical protein